MDDLIERLLACTSEEEQRAVLEAHRDAFSPSDLVSALKARADAHLRDDPAQARALADAATTVATWSDDAEARALAAWARANARYYQGHFPECLALYEKALAFFEQTEDTLSVARLRSNCSAVLSHLGRYAEALDHLEQARLILAPEGPSPYLAGLEMNLAMTYQQLDRYGEAVEACERGRAVALAVGDRARAARLDVNRAVALQGLDRFREAIDLLLATIPVLEEEGEKLEAARAYLNLGWLRFHTGHYRQALIDLEIARQRFDDLDNEMEVATVDLHRAQVYLRLNLLPETIELCQSAQAILLSDRSVLRYAALAEYYAGIAYGRLGERELALQHLTAARDRMAALDLPVQAARIDLERAGLLLEEDIAKAQALAQAAHDLFEVRGLTLKTARAQIALGDVWHRLDQLEDARNAYAEALKTLEDSGPAELRHRAWYGLGRLAEAAGRREEALAHYRQAIEVATTTAAALGASELRAGFLHDKLDAFQAAVSLSLDLGQAEAALELVELARTGGWAPLRGEPTEPPSEEIPPASDAEAEARRLLAEIQQLRETWHWHYSRLRESDTPTDPPSDPDSAREMYTWSELQAVERRLTGAIRTLRLHSGQDSPTHAASAPLADMASRLAEGQSLLAYYIARDQIVAFVADRTGYTAVRLQTRWSLLTRHLDRLMFSLRRQGADTLAHLQWFWQALLAPLQSYLADGRQLIIVPHDRLHYLPFHALHDGTNYLLERCQITYLPAASLLTGRNQRDPQSPTPISDCGLRISDLSLTARPNSKFEIRNSKSDLQLTLACSDHGRLPGVLAEGHIVHATLTSSVGRDAISPSNALLYLDAEATSERLRRHASDCTLLHIAAHGHFRADNPLFSALHLGDGPLLLADLNDLRLSAAPLVVLSACETGLGDLRGGDVLGLSRAFLQAGAETLLVSLWRVPDEATARLMSSFYQHLMNDLSPAAALRQAQRTLLNEPEYEHPRQWAGWMLVGGGG